jgi:hypothetical protein
MDRVTQLPTALGPEWLLLKKHVASAEDKRLTNAVEMTTLI